MQLAAIVKSCGAKKLRAGMTLLEVLSAIIVLMLLAAIILPAVDAVRRSSTRKQAEAEARAIANGVLQYYLHTGAWPNATKTDADLDIVYLNEYCEPETQVDGAHAENRDVVKLFQELRTARADFMVEKPAPSASDAPNHPAIVIGRDGPEHDAANDPWSMADTPSAFVIAVDANGDGFIGRNSGTDASGSFSIDPIRVTRKNPRTGATEEYYIPVSRMKVHVFSWTNGDTNRVSVSIM